MKNSKKTGMEVQCGEGVEIETETSVSLVVFVGNVHCDNIELEEVSMSETIEGILVRVLTKKAEMRHISDYTRVGDPELLALSISTKKEGKISSKYTLSSEDQSQTLQEFLSVAGYYSSSEGSGSGSSSEDGDSDSMSPIELHLLPSWERYLIPRKRMREEWERDDDDDEESGTDEELDMDGVDCIVDKQRPNVLAENKNVLRVVGRLRVCFQDQNGNGIVKCHAVDCLGGLRCESKDVVKLITAAKRVLLVFNDQNLDFMESYYHSYLDHDMSINPHDEVLILVVTWDKFSYWLLRMLRKSIGSQVPIIAFTDADVHQLDLITFLDTPPQKVSKHYGWNDCADLGVGLVDVVNIKWAGLRPSDCHSPSAGVRAISDYDMICDFLEQQGKWPLEVQLFKKFRFFKERLSAIHPKPHPSPFMPSIWKEYIPQKLENEDWI